MLIVVGLVSVAAALAVEPRAAAAASAAGTVALVGGPVAVAGVPLDGVAKPQAARSWLEASAGQEAAAYLVAEAVDSLWYAFFVGWVLLLLGTSPLLLGLAQLLGGEPRWLGGAATLAGSAGMVIGITLAVTGGSDPAYVALAAVTTVVLVWLALSGIRLWRSPGTSAVSAARGRGRGLLSDCS